MAATWQQTAEAMAPASDEFGDCAMNKASLEVRSKLWCPEDLADYLSVPVTWIYKRTRRNGPELIPHIKLGKYVRFDQESIEFQQWLSSHTTSGSAEASVDRLTIAFPVNRVRHEKEGQTSAKGDLSNGS
jgi:hypothetical protein